MRTIPKPLLDLVRLEAGAQVEVYVQDGRLIVSPQRKPRYKLSDLLAQCDPNLPLTAEEEAWLDAPPVGLES